ncbi:amino acid ABC transporter ATP-binding protein [Paenarthrobacter sp. NPDC057981]|uniref:amino acid ABC transporter ATP-binding protein n=1 Tax=Paenarthrobacter sp. NPDC057981 TaxID=3346297 RepID=UPI0036DA98D5
MQTKFSTSPPPPVVSVSGLRKAFSGQEILRDIDFEVAPGEVIAVIGPSGSGKSTLLRCINRLEEPDSGVVRINGTELTGNRRQLNALRQNVGMVFQHFHLFPHMTALGNVMEGPRTVLRLGKAEAEERARDMLAQVGLANKAEAFPRTLSGGQRQRVGIARALAMNPSLMLFDEVTSALDPERVAEVLSVIKKLADKGMTMVLVTHEMNFARRVASRVLFLDEGRIIEDAPPEDIFDAPRNHRIRRFLNHLEWENPINDPTYDAPGNRSLDMAHRG